MGSFGWSAFLLQWNDGCHFNAQRRTNLLTQQLLSLSHRGRGVGSYPVCLNGLKGQNNLAQGKAQRRPGLMIANQRMP